MMRADNSSLPPTTQDRPGSVRIAATYLGASRVDPSVFEDAVTALQDVLVKYMPAADGGAPPSGHSSMLTLSWDGMDLTYTDASRTRLFLPIKYLVYCSAMKKLKNPIVEKNRTYQFQTLNRIVGNEGLSPVLFVAVFKGIRNYISHVFAMHSDHEALEAVNAMMKFYHDHEDAVAAPGIDAMGTIIQPPIASSGPLPRQQSHQLLGFQNLERFAPMDRHMDTTLATQANSLTGSYPLQYGSHVNGSSATMQPKVMSSTMPQMFSEPFDSTTGRSKFQTLDPYIQNLMGGVQEGGPQPPHISGASGAAATNVGYSARHEDGRQMGMDEISRIPGVQNVIADLERADRDAAEHSYKLQSAPHQSQESFRWEPASSSKVATRANSNPTSDRQNVIIRWLQAPSPSGRGVPIVVKEECRQVHPSEGVHILNEQAAMQHSIGGCGGGHRADAISAIIKQGHSPMAIAQHDCCDSSSSNAPTVIIERMMRPSQSQQRPTEIHRVVRSQRSNKVLIPITVNEMKMVKPNPIVVEHTKPIFRTRRRVRKARGKCCEPAPLPYPIGPC